MRNIAAIACSSVAASLALFFVHKPIADLLPQWVSEHMAGAPEIRRPPYGLEVVLPATLSSVEYGLGLGFTYHLLAKALPTWSPIARAVVLLLLTLALMGNLVRFPLMQLVVGNPAGVTLVQHAALWLPYLVGSLVVALAYELVRRHVA